MKVEITEKEYIRLLYRRNIKTLYKAEIAPALIMLLSFIVAWISSTQTGIHKVILVVTAFGCLAIGYVLFYLTSSEYEKEYEKKVKTEAAELLKAA